MNIHNAKPPKSANPLTQASSQKYGALPFDQIHTEHFMPALKQGLEQVYSLLDTIQSNPAPADFANTIEALEFSGEPLSETVGSFYAFLGANTSKELSALAGEFSALLSKLSNDIYLDEQLFARVRKIYESKESLNLTPEQAKLLEDQYQEFVRNGALLNSEDKDQLREIDKTLATLSPKFQDHVLNETNAFEWLIESEEELEGLPESIREAAAHEAETKGKKGWLITLDAPSYVPFMTYSAQRKGREKLWRAYNGRGFQDNPNNNEAIVLEIVLLRHKRAQLLGFPTYADFVLKKRMAESPQQVMDFLDRLLDKARPAALKELEDVKQLAWEMDQIQPDDFKPWDMTYYAEKLRQKKYAFDEEELRPYFSLPQVVDGAFELARRLFKIDFLDKTSNYPVFDPDMKVYEVFRQNSGEFVGLFYTDFFPRPSKRGGAWASTYLEQGLFRGKEVRPHTSIVCNFTKPTPARPSLLTLNEVETLFHEFGHALHMLLSRCRYQSLAGANVYWDFVELPSQLMENWVGEAEGLRLFAKHYSTGQDIPDDLVEKIKKSKRFLAGYYTLRQLNFAFLDMAWHSQDPADIKSVPDFEHQATKKCQIFAPEPGTNLSTAFNHLFAGGYGAGYYSYKWAEVLDADAFEFFLEKGLFSEEVSQRLHDHILSRGGSEHPLELYKKFRGREPDPDALLRRDGLI